MPKPEFDKAARENAEALIRMALAEDLPGLGDLTSSLLIPIDAQGTARFVTRAPGTIAGLPVLDLLARHFRLDCERLVEDSDQAPESAPIASIAGPMRGLLEVERTALNFLQHLSGIATLTRRFLAAVEGTNAAILDTRKTTPGWRALEKYAVRCGGGTNHRLGLHDAVLIKDNHLDWLASRGRVDPIETAIATARSGRSRDTVVEVEVDTLAQFDQALRGLPDIILLDNFDLDDLSEAVRRRDRIASGVKLEASGGVNLSTVAEIARTGVDRISVGALTHSAPALDIGLDFDGVLPS